MRARAQGHTRVRSLARCGEQEWLSLHASCFEGDADGRVAVVLSAPPPAELTPLLMHAYGLSTREREVTLLIADGVTTRQIATALAISEHTVRDHIKAVFDKVGVPSRGGLVAELFADRYQRSVLGTDRISTG